MNACELCPRHCKVDRDKSVGFCGVSNTVKVARRALHMWEEDCISGKEGSGAVFFSGCNLRCVFCQNYSISTACKGQEITIEQLADSFLGLQTQGANNINLVTPTPFLPQIINALDIAFDKGLSIPIVYNCGGYENEECIEKLRGYVDIFLPDMKYADNSIAKKYSGVDDYYEIAVRALDRMFDIVGKPVFDEKGLMKKGMIVRHLMLPGYIKDSKNVLQYLRNRFNNDIYISIMSQYTPLRHVRNYQEINRRLYPAEYKRLVEFAMDIGIVNGFVQDMTTADESFIPEFYDEQGGKI